MMSKQTGEPLLRERRGDLPLPVRGGRRETRETRESAPHERYERSEWTALLPQQAGGGSM